MIDSLYPLEAVSNKLDADVFVYNGEIDLEGTEKLIELTANPSRPNVLLVLCTPGGDPHAAFKIARRLQNKYTLFYLYVYGFCKSAGTLLAIGADEVIMSEFAEFGPLDVQLQEKDEIGRYSSGLNIQESLRILKAEALIFFRSILIDLIDGARISTKTAAELATKLTVGYITPMVSQIDPLRVGETQRAVKIALAYGERLLYKSNNLLSIHALVRLVQEYPDHGFVIDYEEAKKIFKNIRQHDQNEAEFAKSLNIKYPSQQEQIIKKLYPEEKSYEDLNTRRDSEGTRKSEEIPRTADSKTVGDAC